MLKILKLQSGWDGHQDQNLCLTVTLVNVRNNANKNFKDVSTKQLRSFITVVSNVDKSQCQAQILILDIMLLRALPCS